jgi:succinate dehydrogenase / fumarate reductase flavoprotein subunit
VALDAKIPKGALSEKWSNHKFNLKLLAPHNKRKYNIIVVGTGLAGASAAATLAELGYQVQIFCLQDSPRRAHSVAAQGGINAAKNYPNDGDSIERLFLDTLKGGDFRSREANVYRLAEVSNAIIDHAVAQGVPFAREYSGYLDNRSFGGAQLKRSFYAKGQTGQQLLLGAYGQLAKEIKNGNVTIFNRREMMDLILVNGKARGIVVRNLINGRIESYSGHAVILATGGYSNIFYLTTNAKSSNGSAIWAAYKKGAFFANPCFVQIHPTCIPVHGDYQSKHTLMSESLRNDGRVWVPQNKNDKRNPMDIPENERDYFLERKYPSYGNLVPRDIASRAVKQLCDLGYGVGPAGVAVFLDFADAIQEKGAEYIEMQYGNLFSMYQNITATDPYFTPMRIYPAVHYTMGGLWVDYNLMSTIPGLFVLGEANFSDHGANRLGASAMMQGLADGYFIIPYTISDYLVHNEPEELNTEHSAFKDSEKAIAERIELFLNIKGKKPLENFYRELGSILWDKVGMSRNEKSLREAIVEIRGLRTEFWQNANVVGSSVLLNSSLEKANRVADFMEMGELLATDALMRAESCGSHFREEYQTEDGEAKRDDENFSFVAAWEYRGKEQEPLLHREKLTFESIQPMQRSYK